MFLIWVFFGSNLKLGGIWDYNQVIYSCGELIMNHTRIYWLIIDFEDLTCELMAQNGGISCVLKHPQFNFCIHHDVNEQLVGTCAVGDHYLSILSIFVVYLVCKTGILCNLNDHFRVLKLWFVWAVMLVNYADYYLILNDCCVKYQDEDLAILNPFFP